MKKSMVILSMAAIAAGIAVTASEEESLGWRSAVIQCASTAKSGDVSCDIKTGDTGWEKFAIEAFGKTHSLTPTDLKKLEGFPLSSLTTRHEAGWERLGGYTVHFRFSRTFYSPAKKLVTETIYVSVTKNGVTVSERKKREY